MHLEDLVKPARNYFKSLARATTDKSEKNNEKLRKDTVKLAEKSLKYANEVKAWLTPKK